MPHNLSVQVLGSDGDPLKGTKVKIIIDGTSPVGLPATVDNRSPDERTFRRFLLSRFVFSNAMSS